MLKYVSVSSLVELWWSKIQTAFLFCLVIFGALRLGSSACDMLSLDSLLEHRLPFLPPFKIFSWVWLSWPSFLLLASASKSPSIFLRAICWSAELFCFWVFSFSAVCFSYCKSWLSPFCSGFGAKTLVSKVFGIGNY